MVSSEGALAALLASPAEWLAQGDIFVRVPIVEVSVGPTGDVRTTTTSGPAMLFSHGCALDKMTGSGVSLIQRLHFLPLRNVDRLPKDRQSLTRGKVSSVDPSEILYLGNVPEFVESYIVLSEPFVLPVSYFDPELRACTSPHGETEPRLVGRAHSERVGTLADAHLHLFLDKLNAYWTRRKPQ